MLLVLSLLFACQEKEALTCEYDGEIYSVGESFTAADGCNSCSCDEEGEETAVICTVMYCEPGEDSSN